MCYFEKYQIIETLGEGTFGKVKLASWEGNYYAIKFTTRSNAYSPQVLANIFEKEAEILNELSHPNIIKIVEAIRQGHYLKDARDEIRAALVFQYAPHSLGQIVELGALSETIGRTLFSQLLAGLDYLHNRNIIHRDIKPQNILFDTHFTLKICDFGLSAKLNQDSRPKTICGSDAFKSPELLMRKNYNGIMNDLFAAAVTLFVLVTGRPPFQAASPSTGHYKFIAMNYMDKFWTAHQKKGKFSPDLKHLLGSMLAFDPTHRLSISEILSHPWMTGAKLTPQQLETEMRRIETEVLQKKRKAILKNLQGRGLNPVKNAHRSLSESTDCSVPIEKAKYYPTQAKLSDRWVPHLKNYGELEAILQVLGGDLNLKNGRVELTRILSGENSEKIVMEISIESVDSEVDCLKFKLREGDTMEYLQVLQQFDNQLLQ